MGAALLLAIDIGTQSTRAVVFDALGNVLAKAQVPHDPLYVALEPGWAEQDPETYWQAVVTACQQLWSASAIQPHDIAGIAVTTLRSSTVCVDAHGKALRPVMVWLDQRECTAPPKMSGWWNALFFVAGARPLIAHLQRNAECNWLAQHQPQIWANTDKFLLVSGFIAHRLTGEFVESTGSVVGFLPFDYKRQQWADAKDFKWQALAVRPEQLPRLVAPGTVMAGLTQQAAAQLGLPPGLPVVAAAADKACEILGCGIQNPHSAHLSFGTTATINSCQDHYVEVQRMLPAFPGAQHDRFYTEIQIYRGFWMVSWFKREFAAHEVRLAAERGVLAESLFDGLIHEIPPGAMGLTLQPYWSPGVRQPGPEARGAIIGFSDIHTRAHLYRAILEGLIYALQAGRETIEKKLGHALTQVHVSGGGSQSDVAMQITADVFNLPTQRPRCTETSALGAAINLAVGLGVYADHRQAQTAMCHTGTLFTPNPQAVAQYRALYRLVYQKMYPALRPLYLKIRKVTGSPK